MPLSLYDSSIPVFQRTLTTTSTILDKAAAHCTARKIDPAALLTARLFPDMFPLTRQVQLVSDFAKGGAARLAGIDIPKYEDTETSFDELKARLAKTHTFLTGVDRAAIEAGADRSITLTMAGKPVQMTGTALLTSHTLPNLYFHATTAYAILRHGGVEIGKGDFMGRT